MKKNKLILLILLAIAPCVFFFTGCSLVGEKVYVIDIRQTEIVGTTSTYTVYYSNGSTSIFTVENGSNGQDGTDLTLESIKNYCVANNIDFEDFLKQYLTVVNKNETIQQATATAIQSAVSVWCEFPTSNYYNMKDVSISCGAGVIYKMNETDSYIITNYHVVYYTNCNTSNHIARKINIFQYGTSEYWTETGKTDPQGYPEIVYGDGAIEAEYIGGSLNYDIAILKVKTADLLKYNEHAAAVTIADKYELADTAIAIGNPETEGISVTSGIVSVISEEISMKGADDITTCQFRVMRIDAAVNGGNSGGGLFNVKGELIGIVNAKVVDSKIDNIAYALPYDNVAKVADNLIYYHQATNEISSVKNLDLAVDLIALNSRSIYNPTTKTTILKEDIVVESVKLSSPSHNGFSLGHIIGLKTGDIIKTVKINDEVHTLNRVYEFIDLMLIIRAGDKILIEIIRDGTPTTVGITTNEGILESYFTTIR